MYTSSPALGHSPVAFVGVHDRRQNILLSTTILIADLYASV